MLYYLDYNKFQAISLTFTFGAVQSFAKNFSLLENVLKLCFSLNRMAHR
jgi:hypothetical protein